eukprot:4602595-Amphidinium_carterae.2
MGSDCCQGSLVCKWVFCEHVHMPLAWCHQQAQRATMTGYGGCPCGGPGPYGKDYGKGFGKDDACACGLNLLQS